MKGVTYECFKSISLVYAEAPEHAQAWQQLALGLDSASALDKKTEALTYLATLAATGNISGIPFHVLSAKAQGASRQEVVSAILVGLPAAGATVISSLPAALEAYDGLEK